MHLNVYIHQIYKKKEKLIERNKIGYTFEKIYDSNR